MIFLIGFNLIESSLKFNVPSHKEKCFQTTIYIEGALLVRYHLTGFENDYKGDELIDLFKNIKIFIKNEKGQSIYETELKSRKDKFVIKLKENGNYLVCTRYFKTRRSKGLSNSVLMGLKLRTDYDSKNLEETIHKEDINQFWRKINEIKREMRPSIESEKHELKEEDKTAKSLISSVNTYYMLSCIQLVIIVVSTIYTIFTYQDYFKKKSII